MRPSRAAAVLSLAIMAVLAALAGDARPALATVSPGTIATFAGGGVGNGGAATAATVRPLALATDASGNVYVADGGDCTVRKVTSGTITVIAGNGLCVYGGDGGPALAAGFDSPQGIAVDGSGSVYVTERNICVVRKITSGIVTRIAGVAENCSFAGDSGAATSAALNIPVGLWVDGADLYIADSSNCRVRKVSGGTITTVAGNGICNYSGDNGPATSATLWVPNGVTVDGAGSIYIADAANCRVRKVASGTITTFAGNGSCVYGGDNGPATAASLNTAVDVKVDGPGNVYIADNQSCRIRKVTSGVITTMAGNGTCDASGDGGPATSAGVQYPGGLAVDASSNVYIADNNGCRVRKVTSGTINTFAGNGFCSYSGDGGSATNAALSYINDVALDASGNLYIADGSNCRVRKVTPAGIISTFAGNGTCAYAGENGPATAASFHEIRALALDPSGNVYLADNDDCRIRKVSGGTITTVVGNGSCGYSGDGGPATSAEIDDVNGIAADATGNIYLAIGNNCVVRKVSSGTITRFAGVVGDCTYGGDAGPALSARMGTPAGLAVNAAGVLYLVDRGNCRIRAVSGGTINTVAGDGNCAYAGDGLPATQASLSDPRDVALDAASNLYITDANNCVVRRVSIGVIGTVAGDGLCGFSGDGGSATAASFNQAHGGLAVDSQRALYITDYNNRRVRRVTGQDYDGDGCYDAKELGANTLTGGNRNPDDKFDFFDAPVPVLRPADTSGTLSHAVTLADVIAVLFYVGTDSNFPTQTNTSGVMYGSDLNANGTLDGAEYDRTIPNNGTPWRSGAPSGAVTIGDAIVGLQQVGANCG